MDHELTQRQKAALAASTVLMTSIQKEAKAAIDQLKNEVRIMKMVFPDPWLQVWCLHLSQSTGMNLRAAIGYVANEVLEEAAR
tara:strand:+ start:124 stop:372 length:249 start_codon:yes stop_codon:yes gene_type:complete